MVNKQEMMPPENPKRPTGFRHLGSSPFCKGAVQTTKISFNGSIYSTNIRIRLCSPRLGTNLRCMQNALKPRDKEKLKTLKGSQQQQRRINC